MKFVQRGRAEAERLWRLGYTLGDEALDAELQKLLDTLVAGRTTPPGVSLRVRVFQSPANNAFALPDGSIFLFAGLLSQLTTRDQVAFILGHEAEHVLGSHALNWVRASNKRLAATLALSVGIDAAVKSTMINNLMQTGLGAMAMVAVTGYGRDLERAADQSALAGLAGTGLDRCAGAQSLQMMKRQEEEPGRLENLFGSHPLLKDRIRDLSAGAGADDCVFDSTLVSDGYAPIKWPMLKLSAALWVGEREPIRAARAAQAYLTAFPDDADVHTILGDALALAAARDTIAKRRRKTALGPPGPTLRDTLSMAIASYQRALMLGGPDYRPPLRGLALVAERERDTTACIGYLERYLAGDARVKDRRMLHTKLQALGARPSPATARDPEGEE